MATKRVRVLVPFMVNTAANEHVSGDVVDVDANTADAWVASGAAEDAKGENLSTHKDPEPVFPTPLPVGKKGPAAPASAKEQLDAGEGGNTPPFEPLPVGSGPYEAPEAAKEQLDAGEGGNTPPFEPLPVAPESETVRPTDEKGQPIYDATEETEDQEPKTELEDYSAAELKEMAKARGLKASGSKAALIERIQGNDG